jgi:hypothetical protein
MIFEKAIKNLDAWRSSKNFKQEIPEFYRFMDQEIGKQYLDLFGI